MKNKRFLILIFVLFCFINSYGQGIKYTKNDTIKYLVKNELTRFISGTFWSGVEIPLKNKKSIYFSGIATYGSPQSDKQLIGYGAEFQLRNYLGKGDFSTNTPIYMATQFMFRRIDEYKLLTSPVYNTVNGIEQQIGEIRKEEHRSFNVYYGGILIGTQVFVNQMFTIDINVGGGLRLAQIDGEKSFSKYKELVSLDYSGVVPRAGLIIGIVQH
jgi:hypothetical protein